MKLKKITTNEELLAAIEPVDGDSRPYAELIVVDGTTKGVRIGRAQFSQESYSAFQALVEIDREEAERYRVRVDHPAFPALNRYFESEYDSREFQRPYDSIDGATIEAKKVKVQIDDDGKVVAELNDEGVAIPLTPQEDGGDDIPF